jgi:hypothetical protein
MKTQIIASLIFLMLFAGFQIDVQAQASATVNYTIVVTEDMLAGGDDVEPRGFGFENNALYEGYEAASFVSVSLQADNDTGSANGSVSFETEISAIDTPEIADMLELQLNENVADLQSDNINDDGQYLVVMEYN